MIPKINTEEYFYSLPDERIALYPLNERDSSKLLVYNKGQITDDVFINLPNYIEPQSHLVFNNTKVIRARLLFKKLTGATIEVFCLQPAGESIDEALSANKTCTWECTIGNAKKWKDEVLSCKFSFGQKQYELRASRKGFIVHFDWDGEMTFGNVLEAIGNVPIPPYIKRNAEESDKIRYQTVYSKAEGSVAAPTAGLHFTNCIIDSLREKNISLSEVTLHVGAGTFVPVKSQTAAEHVMHAEIFKVELAVLENILPSVGNIIAVGTTSVRMLESLYQLAIVGGNSVSQWQAYDNKEAISAGEAIELLINQMKAKGIDHFYASTSIMIVPGYKFKMIKGMVTNFHQPGSTLMMLVAALIGDNWKQVYNFALNNNYRFLSYGDSSLLLP